MAGRRYRGWVERLRRVRRAKSVGPYGAVNRLLWHRVFDRRSPVRQREFATCDSVGTATHFQPTDAARLSRLLKGVSARLGRAW